MSGTFKLFLIEGNKKDPQEGSTRKESECGRQPCGLWIFLT